MVGEGKRMADERAMKWDGGGRNKCEDRNGDGDGACHQPKWLMWMDTQMYHHCHQSKQLMRMDTQINGLCHRPNWKMRMNTQIYGLCHQ